jgi:uncharacterized membrane protein
MILTLILVLTFIFLPLGLIKLNKALKINKILSDILICYAVGILLGTTKSLWLNQLYENSYLPEIQSVLSESAKITAFAAVLLAMPMLLMLNNAADWMKQSAGATISFFLGSISTMTVCLITGYYFANAIPESEKVAGMMTGVYIGGTPNMVAISKALNADESLFILLNTTDTFCSGLYFFFMLSLAKPFFSFFLKPYYKQNNSNLEQSVGETLSENPSKKIDMSLIRSVLTAVLLAILAIILSLGLGILCSTDGKEPNQTVLMLALTSIGIIFSLVSWIRNLKGVFPFAQYLLLIFGISAGFMVDFGDVMRHGSVFLTMNAIVVPSILLLHFILAKIFRIDVDTFMVSSVANVMGPPFIAQVCSSIKNKEIIPIGIALGLLGLAIANYCGILIYTILSFMN